jgi:formate C-acetyltransferase
LFNQKFLPQYLREHKDEFIAWFKVWVKLGIHHIQFNIIKREELEEAQVQPEDYSTLVVRQAGLAAYFVDLEKMVQDEIIDRTEHGHI